MNAAVRTTYTLKEKNVEEGFKLAFECLDIYVNMLYKIWGKIIIKGEIPCSVKGRTRAVRIKFVAMEWFKPIRKETKCVRLIAKRSVELLDIQIGF
jgi:hypothetical protein